MVRVKDTPEKSLKIPHMLATPRYVSESGPQRAVRLSFLDVPPSQLSAHPLPSFTTKGKRKLTFSMSAGRATIGTRSAFTLTSLVASSY